MLDFLTGCIGLFTDTYNAAADLEFFRFLSGFLAFQASVIIFTLAAKTTRRM